MKLNLKKSLVALAVLSAAVMQSAQAALPAGITTALTDTGADAALAVGAGGLALLGLSGVGVVWAIAISYIRRMRRG